MKSIRYSSYFLIAMIPVLLLNCSKDYYDPDAIIENYFIKDIPQGFNWSTISKTEVNVTPNDTYNGQYFYTIEIFDANPLIESEEALSLLKGVCKQGQPLTGTIIIPSALSKVFIAQTSPSGSKSVMMADVKVGKIECSFLAEEGTTLQSKTFARMVSRAADNEEPDVSIPANAEEITPGNANTSWGRTACKISAGNTYTGGITFPDGQKNQLYVEGTWRVSGSSRLPNNSEIFILDGGKIIPTGNWELDLTSASIRILEGGAIGTEEDDDSNIKFNSNCNFINYGRIYMNNFVLTGGNGSKIDNYGELHFDEISSHDSGIKINNNGIMNGEKLNLRGNTSFINQCIATFEEMTLTSTTIDIAGYSSVTCEELSMLGATVNLYNNAILKVTEEATMDNNSKNFFSGKGNGKEATSLLVIKTIKWKNSSEYYNPYNTEFHGDLQLNCSNLVDSKNQYMFSDKTKHTSTSTVEIKKYKCSIGNTPDHEEEPENPEFPLPDVNGYPYTWVSEDNYPNMQYDYDINDLVVGIESITYYRNSDNSIKQMDVHLQLRAIGATKRLGAALQLQGIHGCEATMSRNLFEFEANRTIERDKEGDVIPLFDNAHLAMGVTERVNVFAGGPKQEPVDFTIQVTFPNAISSNSLNISNFNFFVIEGESFRKKRKEIHVSGIGNFKHTSQSITPSKVQTDLSNLFWGLLVPGKFEYPIESGNINDAYPNFSKWVESGGSDYMDWYKTDKNEKLIYKD